ncbi:MAG: hypothetical protein U0641_16920 [Anaerolineae bacterium]
MRYDGPMSPYGCGRAVRRGCGCLVGLLVILALLACMLGYGVSRGFVRAAHAAGPNDAMATQLSPAVPEAPRTPTAHGVFFDAHVSVTIAARQLRLAGSPDGEGQLCTDDRATLTFRSTSGESFVWRHTFHQNAQTGIYCIPPVDLTGQVTPGVYDVEVQLEDVVPYTYSSTAYYLVAFPEPTATPAPSPSAAPTAPRAVAEVAAEATPTATPRDVTPTPTPGAAVAPEAGDGEGASALSLWWPLALAVVAVVGLAGAIIAFKIRGAAAPDGPHLSGTADLTDRETGESRQVSLFQYPRGARLTRHPLGLAGLASPASIGETIGYLLPSAQGPLLYVDPPGASGGAAPTPMQPGHGYTVAAGVVEVSYRPFDPARTGRSMRRAQGRT